MPLLRLASPSRARPPHAESWRQVARATAECEVDPGSTQPDRLNRARTKDLQSWKDLAMEPLSKAPEPFAEAARLVLHPPSACSGVKALRNTSCASGSPPKL